MVKALIIDDGVDILNYCHQFISDGFEYDHIRSGKRLSKDLKKTAYNLILLDKNFAKANTSELLGPVEDVENEGLRILSTIKRLDHTIPVIMVTAHADYDSMSSALHLGAFDYVEWDALQKDSLFLKLKMQRAVQWERTARQELIQKYNRWDLVGRSETMVRFFQQLEAVLNSESNVLLRGDTGTGKGLAAKIIHQHGPRSKNSYVTIDCTTIPPNLMESELFGHEKGAFTDAKDKKTGRFVLAHGGDLFLDEIGELSGNLQAKLLRAVEEKEVDPIGSSKPAKVDVRIISATNRNIESMVQEGSLRSDLYYRLKVMEITIPSLAERMEDIPLLISHFIRKESEKIGKEITGVTREAADHLCHRNWEGNVRELENLIEAAVRRADRLITLKDLLESGVGGEKPTTSPHGLCSNESPADDCPVFMGASMSHIEKVAIVNALKSNQGLVEPASRALGISKATMYNKVGQYGLSHLIKGYAGR